MRLLIIEDDKDIATALRTELEAQSFAVDHAPDGEKGSYMARTNQYDLILLDLMMPKRNGIDVCKDIRNAGSAVPIIILTVESKTEDKVGLLNAGADDYVTKPFVFSELLARIRALLRRPHTIETPVLNIEDLSLDTTKQKVVRGDKEVYLTRKEYALLEYLMRHQGSVVSRGMIMEHVWDSETDPFSNTIEAHILNLRRKIEGAKARPLIHTIPGRGYKIDSIR